MEFILLVAGAVALVLLWRRVDQLERQLRDVQAMALDLRVREPASPEAAAPPVHEEAIAKPPLTRRAATILPKREASQPAKAVVEGVEKPSAPEPQRSRFAFDFEELFGRQLPIWAGGITLAVAGFFLVRYAIDVGLLSPAVRVAMGLVFGLGLIGGAEAAHQFRDRVADVRVPQALSGAGLATLYASIFLAGTFYGLIGAGTAFVGLALVTAAAIGLSFRFGLPSAILGLVGGFAAPALVGSEESNLPLLAFYLALVAGGLGHAARKQGTGWAHGGWLGLAGIAGGLGWGLVMLIAQPSAPGDVVSVGFYLVVLGALLPALVLPDLRESRWLRLAAGGFASLQMAVLLEYSGYEPLSWGLYLLLGGAFAVLGWRNAGLRDASAIASAVGAWMLGFWYTPDPWLFTGVAAALVAVFAGVPIAQLWRDDARGSDIAALALVPLGVVLAAYWQFVTFEASREMLVGLAGLALAALPALGAWRVGPATGWRSAVLEGSAVLTAYAGVAQLVDSDWHAWIVASSAVALAIGLADRRWAARTALAITLVWAAFPFGWWLGAGFYTLGGEAGLVSDFPSFEDALLYMLPAAVAAMALTLGQQAVTHIPAKLAAALGAILALATAHIGFKQVFAIRERIDAQPQWHDFVQLGLAERTVWEGLLLATAVAAWRLRARWPVARHAAAALSAAAFAHFAWYSGLVHNPLWAEQAVGPTPIANLLVPAYAIGAAALLLLRENQRLPDTLARPARVAVDAVLMMLISLFALSQLRQIFAGTILLDPPVGQAEDLLRSLLGIVLAVGFLLWGARTGTRSWRIGSLVLLLGAVCKVFIYDTIGLDGLVRIASFLALGFSLIGIGWFYSRVLRAPSVAASGEPPMPSSPPDPAAPASGSTAPS